jgi:hypothetical protein
MKLFCVGCERTIEQPDLDGLQIVGIYKGICKRCKLIIENIKKHGRSDLLK